MTKWKNILLLTLFTLICIQLANADILYLKNGRRIEGVIVSETEESVEMKIGPGASIIQNRSRIESIEYIGINEDVYHEGEISVEEEIGIMDLYNVIKNSKNKDDLSTKVMGLGKSNLEKIAAEVSIVINIFLNLALAAAIVLIVLVMCRINKTLPFGVKLARANILFILIFMISGIFGFLIFFLPKMIVLIAPGIFVPFLIVMGVQLIFLKIMYWLFTSLAEFNPRARIVQIIFSILGILNFPLGTAINGVILYSLFRKENKILFEDPKVKL